MGRTWDESESDRRSQWDSTRGNSTEEWEQAKGAQDSWERVNRTCNGYRQSDDDFRTRFDPSPFRSTDDSGQDSCENFSPAYRHGTQQRYAAKGLPGTTHLRTR